MGKVIGAISAIGAMKLTPATPEVDTDGGGQRGAGGASRGAGVTAVRKVVGAVSVIGAMLPPGGAEAHNLTGKAEAMAPSTPGDLVKGLLDVGSRGLMGVGSESDPAASDPSCAGGKEVHLEP